MSRTATSTSSVERTGPDQARVDSGPLLQRKCGCGGACEDCGRKNELQRSAIGGARSPELAPGGVRDLLRSTTGMPLDGAARALMESRFSRDFSRVRVHTGREADASARAVDAEAYTVGQHIVFRDGRYRPSSSDGRGLLAHELAHTVQQGDVAATHRPLPVSAPGDAGEEAADRAASHAAAAAPPADAGRGAAQIARATRNFFLTFDDGPHAAALCKGTNRTEKVLNTLCTKSVQGGFFVQTAAQDAAGAKIRGSSAVGKKLITRMSTDGHKVGIHTGGTRDHEAHTAAEAAGRLDPELTAAKAAITTLTGATPTMVRPPFGKFNTAVSATYSKVGLTNVLWDIDGDQGKDLPLADLKARVTSGISSKVAGGWKGTTPLAPDIVVLYHDIKAGSANNVGTLIDFIKTETTRLTGGADSASFPTVSCTPPACGEEKKPEEKAPAPAPEKPPGTKPPEPRSMWERFSDWWWS